jgi:hypothetical protein
MSQTGQFPYPSHNVPPEKKDAEWCMKYAKAAYYDFSYIYPKGVLANNGGDYEKNRMYALGKQPVTTYKKLLGVDTETNQTWLAVDWTIRAIISGYRDKAISKMMKEDYGFICTPIDMLAKEEQDDYYVQMKAKLAVRQLMAQQNPQLADHPLISVQKGEPEDLEELEMRFQMGEQFNRSKDAELAIELGMYENDYKHLRRRFYEDLFDYGVCGAKDWLGDDNKAKFRRVNPESAITSYAENGLFTDIVHAGESIEVPLVELATVKDKDGNDLFTEKELQEFAGTIAGKFGNPMAMGMTSAMLNPVDKFKCNVLDIEFFTYNEETYSDRKDRNGNPVFKREESGRGEPDNPRYKRKSIQYVYKCKWVIGTDKCYDWGMCYDQKRSTDVKKKAKTKLSFTFCAYNFYKMKAQSFMSKLIPYLDDYQLTMLKIQNFKNRAVPSGWWIDLDALESVALNKGGKNMEPSELLQMFFETGVLVGRSVKEDGTPQSPNWKPVIPIENTAASELAMFYNDIINTIQTIERMTGFNDVTMGNPNPKTLVPGYEQGIQSTQDALYPMMFAEEYVSTRLAENVLCRMQQGIKKGEISGYAPALGSNTLRAIKLSPNIGLHDYGIEIEMRSSQDERMWLLQHMEKDIDNGYLDTSASVMLINTHNVKQAQQIWSYKVTKEKQRLAAQKMAEIQEQNVGTQEAAKIAQQGAMMQLKMQYDFELQKEQQRIISEQTIKMEQIASAERIATWNNNTKIIVAADTADAKENSTQIAGQASIVKQQVANEKPTATPKK